MGMPVDFAKIEKLRIRAAMTQSEAAAKVGMSRQEWCNLVKGRYPRMAVVTLERIAKALGVRAAELLK
jgi:DNA-binding XRE family transcriptional regulator